MQAFSSPCMESRSKSTFCIPTLNIHSYTLYTQVYHIPAHRAAVHYQGIPYRFSNTFSVTFVTGKPRNLNLIDFQ